MPNPMMAVLLSQALDESKRAAHEWRPAPPRTDDRPSPMRRLLSRVR